MKMLLLILLYVGVFFGMFFLLSLFGLVWISDYSKIIGDGNWFCFYLLLIGWWVALLPTIEVADQMGYDV